MSLLLSLSIAGCAPESPTPHEEPAPPPPALLRASAASPGEPLTLRVEGATGSEAHLARGVAWRPGATCPPTLAPACLDLVGARLVASEPVDGAGAAAFEVWVPASARLGAVVPLQAVVGPGLVTPPLRVTVVAPINLAGAWDDAWGGYAEVTHDRWRDGWGGVWHLLDHGDGWAVARNDVGNPFFPGLFSRFDWTWSGGQAWYCQSGYDAPSEAAARSTPPADPTAPAIGGCGGFAWTALSPADPDVAGSWVDAFGGAHTIDAGRWDQGWSSWTVASFSNLDGVMIAQNDPTNPYFPGMWSRFDWTWSGADLWYCQSAYDAPSQRAARQALPADAGDLTGGCGGFPWTLLLP